MKNITELLELLSLHGGKIVCSALCDPEEIRQAVASGRMYVDDNNIGFIWDPGIMKFPQTESEVDFFEKWYPLDPDIPKEYFDKMWHRILKNKAK